MLDLKLKSNYMINFICEFLTANLQNMRIAYLRQRLLVMIFLEKFYLKKGIVSKREGVISLWKIEIKYFDS